MRKRRWSDNDKYFGPFTFSKNEESYRPVCLVVDSGDEEDPGCSIRLSIPWFTLICALPPIVRPYRERVYPESWSEETIQRLGRNWYEQIHPCQYGFSLNAGFLQVFFGRDTMDSSTTRAWSRHLPWTQWRQVRHSLYDTEGNEVWVEPDGQGRGGLEGVHDLMEAHDNCPKVRFLFEDYDGEQIEATTHVEEYEWRFGEGHFKWLSWFRKPKISRSLRIDFSSEVGPEKGSWKGGTMGHSIEIHPGEPHDTAFRRYCAKHNLIFISSLEV